MNGIHPGVVPVLLAVCLAGGAWAGEQARPQADGLLRAAALTQGATDTQALDTHVDAVLRLALRYRDPRCAGFLRGLLAPADVASATGDLPDERLDQLAAAALVLNDTPSAILIWRRATRRAGNVSPAMRAALLDLARPEQAGIYTYSLFSDHTELARLTDAVLRRLGLSFPGDHRAWDVETALAPLHSAMAARRSWLDARQGREDSGTLAPVHSLVRLHTETAGLLGDFSAAPRLRGMLAGGVLGNQAMAARALARLDDDRWRIWALDQLHTEEGDATPGLERITAAELLAAAGDPVGRDLLVGWLHTGKQEVVAECLGALVRLSSPQAAPGLRAWHAAHPHSPHRALAALALAVSGDHRALAEAWEARDLLLRYDVGRETPINPRHALARALGLTVDDLPMGPSWDEPHLRATLGIDAPAPHAAQP